MKLGLSLLLFTTLIFSQGAFANGSETASKGSTIIASGSVMIIAGGASVIAETAAASGTMIVHSVETTGEIITITLQATVDSAKLATVHLSAATAIASGLVAGAVVSVTTVTSAAVGGTSVVIGHLLTHAGEVLLFIPHHDLAIGLHSHAM